MSSGNDATARNGIGPAVVIAREFDQLSAEDGRNWAATDFVRLLADEWRASAEPQWERVSEAALFR